MMGAMPEDRGPIRLTETERRRVLALTAIGNERRAQDERWGDQHDNTHTLSDWLAILAIYQGRAASQAMGHGDGATDGDPWSVTSGRLSYRLIQIAAIALAAIEQIDRERVGKSLPSVLPGYAGRRK